MGVCYKGRNVKINILEGMQCTHYYFDVTLPIKQNRTLAIYRTINQAT